MWNAYQSEYVISQKGLSVAKRGRFGTGWSKPWSLILGQFNMPYAEVEVFQEKSPPHSQYRLQEERRSLGGDKKQSTAALSLL